MKEIIKSARSIFFLFSVGSRTDVEGCFLALLLPGQLLPAGLQEGATASVERTAARFAPAELVRPAPHLGEGCPFDLTAPAVYQDLLVGELGPAPHRVTGRPGAAQPVLHEAVEAAAM